ncbi:hypothetical protein [Salinicola peritrichatus]|uniref:hypothetical protein n=1 Tax=Salinicola peritrichatus TaxID=1267424 RepID=UPI000DA1B353|nr:hypothetical protein [Salinicola peritrichatus]
MDVYKLQTSDWDELPLDKETFEASTGKQKPWYTNNRGGDPATFAVCPGCDNPILILGFLFKLANTDAPYARHYQGNVEGLAEYRDWAYENCPYSNPQEYDRNSRRPAADPLGDKILDILVPNFDRVVYLLEKDIGIRISYALAKQMLEDYRDWDGHLYMGATLQNIPWVFAYMTVSKSLAGRVVFNNPELLAAIEEHQVRGVVIDHKSHRIGWQEGKYLSLDVCFIHHRARHSNQHLEETMVMQVTTGRPPHAREIYRQTIEFNRDHFKNLLNMSPERAKRPRREELVELAEEILGTR